MKNTEKRCSPTWSSPTRVALSTSAQPEGPPGAPGVDAAFTLLQPLETRRQYPKTRSLTVSAEPPFSPVRIV